MRTTSAVHEVVAGALHQPRARQAQVGSTLRAGQQLVDIGSRSKHGERSMTVTSYLRPRRCATAIPAKFAPTSGCGVPRGLHQNTARWGKSQGA